MYDTKTQVMMDRVVPVKCRRNRSRRLDTSGVVVSMTTIRTTTALLLLLILVLAQMKISSSSSSSFVNILLRHQTGGAAAAMVPSVPFRQTRTAAGIVDARRFSVPSGRAGICRTGSSAQRRDASFPIRTDPFHSSISNIRHCAFATLTSLSSSSEQQEGPADITGKTVLLRNIYTLTKYSDVSNLTEYAVEERTRYTVDSAGTLDPFGHRTFILRGPPFAGDDDIDPPREYKPDGTRKTFVRIGAELRRLDIREVEGENGDHTPDGNVYHAGVGGHAHDSSIAMILYFLSNPRLIRGKVLELGCGVGLGGLLSCVGAGLTAPDVLHEQNVKTLSLDDDDEEEEEEEEEGEEEEGFQSIEDIGASPRAGAPSPSGDKAKEGHNEQTSTPTTSTADEISDEILPHREKSPPLPPLFDSLTLSDANEQVLNMAFKNCKHSGLPSSKVQIMQLDWDRRLPSNLRAMYDTIIGSDIVYSFPEVKFLSRTVAFAMQPSPYNTQVHDQIHGGKFVHIGPYNRDVLLDLKRKLRDGYKMNVDSDYLQVQKVMLSPIILDSEAEEAQSDEMIMKEQGGWVQYQQVSKPLKFMSIVAEHNEDYDGENGEFFWPAETGAEETKNVGRDIEPDVGYGGGGGGSGWTRRTGAW